MSYDISWSQNSFWLLHGNKPASVAKDTHGKSVSLKKSNVQIFCMMFTWEIESLEQDDYSVPSWGWVSAPWGSLRWHLELNRGRLPELSFCSTPTTPLSTGPIRTAPAFEWPTDIHYLKQHTTSASYINHPTQPFLSLQEQVLVTLAKYLCKVQ